MWKLAAAALALSISSGAQADQTVPADEVLSDEAIILFNGDETDLTDEEFEMFNQLGQEGFEIYQDRGRGRGSRMIRTVRMRCASRPFFNGITRCRVPVAGQIQQVRLLRRLSFFPCIAGRTFGANPRAIWVRNGCAGDFAVRVVVNRGRGPRTDAPQM